MTRPRRWERDESAGRLEPILRAIFGSSADLLSVFASPDPTVQAKVREANREYSRQVAADKGWRRIVARAFSDPLALDAWLARAPEGQDGQDYAVWLHPLTKDKSGVYAIRETSSRTVLYVGESHSGDLYTTLTRHFQHWDGRSERTRRTVGRTYDRQAVEVRVWLCPGSRAVALQNAKIRALAPRDNVAGVDDAAGDELAPF